MNTVDTIKILGSLLGSGALSKGSGGGVLGSILGSALGGSQNQQTQSGGNLGDVLGGLIGGGQQSGGALGNILGSVLGGGGGQKSGGGLGDILGSVLGGGGSSQSSGGAADILGSLLGAGSGNSKGLGGAGGLGGLLGAAVAKHAQSESTKAPDPEINFSEYLPQGVEQTQAVDHATLVIRAMINSAKSDGNIDQAEQDEIVGKLGKVSADEVEFIRSEFAAPLDVEGFARSIPRGMEQQIYAVSLMAIDLDTNKEANYLHQLAKGLGIEPQLANQLHDKLGVRKIYA